MHRAAAVWGRGVSGAQHDVGETRALLQFSCCLAALEVAGAGVLHLENVCRVAPPTPHRRDHKGEQREAQAEHAGHGDHDVLLGERDDTAHFTIDERMEMLDAECRLPIQNRLRKDDSTVQE